MEMRKVEDKKTKIYDCGKEIFSNKGFKDTNVSDITKKAGIAIGTFYNYYPSKEKLFMDIFLEENAKLKKNCMESLDMTQSPVIVIRQMMALNVEGIISSPILKEWYNKSVFGKIEQLYLEETGIQVNDFLYDSFHEIVQQWQTEGKMRSDMDSKMIMMVFAAMINVETHKEEIGLEFFPQLLDHMMELIMKGLTDCPK
jgi:AcrR family transcriptional regulator